MPRVKVFFIFDCMISFDYTFLSALLSVILIDLVLAGDNAVVIALAVRNLPPSQKRWGIILGADAAVGLRVLCTFFAAQMLRIMFLKFIGGALILWIAVKLLTQEHADENVSAAAGAADRRFLRDHHFSATIPPFVAS